MLLFVFLPLLLGSWVYCLLILVAARKYLAVRPPASVAPFEPVSILKPLSGLDEGLEANLRSFFEQEYRGEFEILLAARQESDAAVPVVRQLQSEYPGVVSRLLIVGEPPYPNAKVWSLEKMMAAASHDLLVMADSDMRVGPDLLQVTAAEFGADPKLGVATCPYRAIAGASLWSRLEAVGMNTEFFGGVLVARMLEGVKFALGPTIVARKRCLDAIGGWERLNRYLAEDFVMGNFAAEAGWHVILSSYVVEHRIGSESFAKNAAHRVRWARSTRRSRPAGYVGQVFTNPLPLALLAVAAAPRLWPFILPMTVLLRMLAARTVAVDVLRTPVGWLLLGWQDLLSFVFWIAGFFGNTIEWRGRRYRLHADGTFTPIG
jgi:ceramide glucosyltransferase